MPIVSPFNKLTLLILIVTSLNIKNLVWCLKQESKLTQEHELHFEEAFEDYRTIFESRGLFHLKSAGILDNEEVQSDQGNRLKNIVRNSSLKFDSNEYVKKSISWQAFTAAADVTSRHNYDDPNDIKLAAGPHVNQRWCKLHLDYMLHMVNKHNKHITRSTELSIFKIMNSFGSPSFGFASGNPVFPGDYRACLENKLNIIRRELVQVNKQETEEFFKQVDQQDNKISKPLARKLFEGLTFYLGKFVGFVDRKGDLDEELIKKYSNKLRLIPTRYCYAALRWPNWSNSSYDRRNMVLRSATCLPDTCDSSSIELYHDKIKQLTESQMPDYFKGFYISNLYCLPDENSELRNPFNDPKTVSFLTLTVVWFSLTTIVTLVDYFRPEVFNKPEDQVEGHSSPWLRFLSYLCLTRNIRDFWSAREKREETYSAGRENCSLDLNSLEGLKVFASFAVIAAHGMVLSSTSCWNPNQNHMIMSSSLLATISTVCPSSVDCFFVITGVLTSIGLMKLPRKTIAKPAFWLQFLTLRYLRIVPFYLIIHLSLQTFPPFLASGPFWDYGTSKTSWAYICKNDSPWNVILLLANFKSPLEHCNPVGWYLANDIQFSLVTPFIILLYLKRPFMGHFTVLVTCLAVMANHIKFYYYQPQGRGGLEFSAMTLNYLLKDASPGYTNPQYRCLAYFIGLATGQLLHQYKHREMKNWPKFFVPTCKILIWSVVYILCAGPYLALMLPSTNLPFLHVLGSIYGGTIHGFTSIGVGALILLLCTGNLPTINNMLSLKLFRPFARASLSTVLIHITIIFYHTHSRRIPAEISVHKVVTNNTIWIIESLAASGLLHVVVELPLRKFFTKSLMTLFSKKEVERKVAESKETNNNLTEKLKNS